MSKCHNKNLNGELLKRCFLKDNGIETELPANMLELLVNPLCLRLKVIGNGDLY